MNKSYYNFSREIRNMKSIIIYLLLSFIVGILSAQEPAKYRITYDCDAQIISGKYSKHSWTLDIGENTSIFYNLNYRLFTDETAEIRAAGGAFALLNKLPELGKKYPTKSDMQIVTGLPQNGKYSYYHQVSISKLKYEEPLPTIDWQMTDSTRTICEYECQQAIGKVYGRTWTVWYATDLPLNYGPYVLQGLPGLILAAKDSEGLFEYVAVGIENAPEDAMISVYDEANYQKTTRKRFLKIRTESEGISRRQALERALDGAKVFSVRDENGKDILDEERPKKNYLDKE